MADETQAPAAAPQTPTEDTVELKLSKPIQVFADQVSVLKLRRPTGADLIKVGNPVIWFFNEDGLIDHTDFDFGRVRLMLARLANIPASSVDMMSPNDLSAAAWRMSGFFVPTAAAA